jgi:hypothetical protein
VVAHVDPLLYVRREYTERKGTKRPYTSNVLHNEVQDEVQDKVQHGTADRAKETRTSALKGAANSANDGAGAGRDPRFNKLQSKQLSSPEDLHEQRPGFRDYRNLPSGGRGYGGDVSYIWA